MYLLYVLHLGVEDHISCSYVWSRTLTFQFLVVEGEFLVFKVFSLDRVQQRCILLRNAFLSGLWSRSLLFPVFGGGLQDFRPGQSSTSSLHVPAGVLEVLDEPGEGIFRTFQNKKSATLGPHSGSELSADFTSSTPTAHVDSWVDGDDVWIRIDSVQGPYWSKLLSDHWQWYPPWEGR